MWETGEHLGYVYVDAKLEIQLLSADIFFQRTMFKISSLTESQVCGVFFDNVTSIQP